MSPLDKQTHIQKRKQQNFRTKAPNKPRFKFFSRNTRPIFKKMSYNSRRFYLKGLLKIATYEGKIKTLPFYSNILEKLTVRSIKNITKINNSRSYEKSVGKY